MRNAIRRLLREQRGSALVELSLCMPALVVLFLGVADYSRVFYYTCEISSAAWSGVMYAASDPSHYTDTVGIKTVANNDAQDIGTLTVNSSKFCQENETVVSCASTYNRVYVQVQTSKTFSPVISWPGLPSSGSITQTVSLRVK